MTGDDQTPAVGTLTCWQRVLLGWFGAVTLGVGFWLLLFTSKEGLAVVTCLVIGALALLLAIVGWMPMRLTGGGVGLDFIARKDKAG